MIILYGTLLRKNSLGKAIPCPEDHRTGLMSKTGGQRIQAKGGQTARAATKASKEMILEVINKVIPILDNGRGHQTAFRIGLKALNNPLVPLEFLNEVLKDVRLSL